MTEISENSHFADPQDGETEEELSVESSKLEDSKSANTETQETFPAEYVRQLRQEAAEARVKAKKADDYAKELFYARVGALGKLADATDIEYAEGLLDDHPALERAVDELISRKPHLAARVPRGDVGQGDRGGSADVDLAGMLRRNA